MLVILSLKTFLLNPADYFWRSSLKMSEFRNFPLWSINWAWCILLMPENDIFIFLYPKNEEFTNILNIANKCYMNEFVLENDAQKSITFFLASFKEVCWWGLLSYKTSHKIIWISYIFQVCQSHNYGSKL